MRDKPQRGNPAHSSETVYRQMLNEWIADANLEAADRIEKAIEKLEVVASNGELARVLGQALGRDVAQRLRVAFVGGDERETIDFRDPVPRPEPTVEFYCVRCNMKTPHARY